MDHPPFDEDVADRARSGDPEALAVVYRTLIAPLTSWLRTQTRSPGAAEDLAQDTFLEFVRDCRTLTGGPAEMRAWLYRAARHNAIDAGRYRQRHPEDPVDEIPDEPRADYGDPQDETTHEELARTVRAALDRLTRGQRDAVTLRHLAGLSGPETATVMGKRVGAVRMLERRGLARLSQLLDRDLVDAVAPPVVAEAGT